MTTFQTIICLAILAVLVGAYMFYQAYKAKNTKIEFTPENIKEMLSDLGASDVSFPEEGGVLFQTEYNKIFWLDTGHSQLVRLVRLFNLNEHIGLDIMRNTAEWANNNIIGLHASVYDDRTIQLSCTSFMNSCNTLNEVLPFMISYLEECRKELILYNHLIPIKADKET